MADEPLTPEVLEEKIRSATDGEFLREPDWAACIELSDALNANRNLYGFGNAFVTFDYMLISSHKFAKCTTRC